jgi:multiple sugar transport system substrate-binding protein
MTIGRRTLAALLGLTLLFSFGLAWSGQRQVQKVNILMPAPFADATAELVQRFNREHRGSIALRVTRGPRDTEAISDLAISSLLLGRPPFDALLMDVTWLAKYAAAGWLEPLDSFFDSEEIDALVEGARLGNHYDGVLYRWPLIADVGLLYWRKDLMDTPPRTPEQLSGLGSRLIADGAVNTGFVWQGRQYEGLSCDFVEMLSAFGGSWLNPQSGEPSLDSPEALEAVAWMRSLIRDGISPKAVTNYSESESLQAFKAGDAALMRNWPYAWAELQKPDSAVRGQVGVTLMVSNEGDRSAATLGSWGLSLLKGSDHPEAVIEAIRFLTSREAQRERFRNQGYTPTDRSLFRDPEMLELSPILPDLEQALSHAVPRPPTPLYAQLSDVLQRQLSAVLTDDVAIEQAMTKAQRNSSTIVESAGGAS